MFPWSNDYRRTTAKSLSSNVAIGVIVGVVSYYGYFAHNTKHSVPWAIILGIAAIIVSFFLYRWRTAPDESDRGSRVENGPGQAGL